MATTEVVASGTVEVTVRLDGHTVEALDSLAVEEGLARPEFVRRLVEQWLAEEEEDRWLAEVAERRLSDPDSEWIPWEQAKAELGL